MKTEQPLPLLDDQVKVKGIDTKNYLRIIDELPEQCETALAIGRSTKVVPFEELYNSICITGVGDNAIAADIAAVILSDYCDIPIVINHGENLPLSVGAKTLVFAIDYTGKSKCTLANFNEAVARKSTVYCLAGSGPLLAHANSVGTNIVRIPPGHLMSSAIGYLFMPIISIIDSMGLASGAVNKLVSSIMLMKNYREFFRVSYPAAKNIAKKTAEEIVNKSVVIFGASGYLETVARRFESQLINTSHALASFFILPDNTSHWGLLQIEKNTK